MNGSRNPGRPSALGQDDLVVDRHIILCHDGARTAATIVKGPHMGFDSGSEPLYVGEPKTLVILVRYGSVGGGKAGDDALGSCCLVSIGVLPDSDTGWDPNTYVLAA